MDNRCYLAEQWSTHCHRFTNFIFFSCNKQMTHIWHTLSYMPHDLPHCNLYSSSIFISCNDTFFLLGIPLGLEEPAGGHWGPWYKSTWDQWHWVEKNWESAQAIPPDWLRKCVVGSTVFTCSSPGALHPNLNLSQFCFPHFFSFFFYSQYRNNQRLQTVKPWTATAHCTEILLMPHNKQELPQKR